MNKADQMINRIHNLNLIISKEEKAVHLRASHLHFIKNNYIPADRDLCHAALVANTFLDFKGGKKGKRTPHGAAVLTEPSTQKGKELIKHFHTLLG